MLQSIYINSNEFLIFEYSRTILLPSFQDTVQNIGVFEVSERRSGEASKRWKLVRRHKIAKRNSTTPADTCITQDNAGCRKRRRYFMLEKCCCRLKRNKLLWSFWPGRTFYQVPYHYSVDIFIQRIFKGGGERSEKEGKFEITIRFVNNDCQRWLNGEENCWYYRIPDINVWLFLNLM